MSSRLTIRIGYVPEHYLTPLHLALRSPLAQSLPFTLQPIPFPSGTGHMITSLRDKEIDLAIGLTEGWVAGLAGKSQTTAQPDPEKADGGYRVVGQWVDTPLRWAIVTGRERQGIDSVGDLKGGRVGVSRMGSGSHIMSFVLAQQQGWSPTSLTPTPLGPFSALRDGVQDSNTADFFMWEHFTTKPFFDGVTTPLKKIGEIFTPWPSWMLVASTSTFPTIETDETLAQVFQLLDSGLDEFRQDTGKVVQLLGTGELGCEYSAEDAGEWLKDVRFSAETRGVDAEVVMGVVDVLKEAGVIDRAVTGGEVVKRVIGVSR